MPSSDVNTIKMITRKLAGTTEIYAFGDLHIGARETDISRIKEVVKEILEQPNRYCVLTGDFVDNGIKSSVTSCYDAMYQPAEQRRLAIEILKPLVDAKRVLCMVGGNHEYRTRKDCDISPAEIIASKLGIEDLYREEIAFLKIDLGERSSSNYKAPKYAVCVAHGAGGGALLGSGLSKAETFGLSMGCDLLITGHTHKPSTAATARLECDMSHGVMRREETRVLIGTGYLNYFDDRGNGGYPARKMLRPVVVRPNKAVLDGYRFDVSVVS